MILTKLTLRYFSQVGENLALFFTGKQEKLCLIFCRQEKTLHYFLQVNGGGTVLFFAGRRKPCIIFYRYIGEALSYFLQVGENLVLFFTSELRCSISFILQKQGLYKNCKVPILVPFIYKLLNYRCCCSEDGT